MMRIGIVYGEEELNSRDILGIRDILERYKIDYEVYPEENIGGISEELDMIIAIGGDSLVLKTLLNLSEIEIPILSLYGRRSKGFLYVAGLDRFTEIINMVIQGNYIIEERTRLGIRMGGRKLPSVLNDAVILSRDAGRLIRYTLYIDNEYIWRDDADGVIISTPTGSTAYALSAGGAIIRDADVIEIVPINTLIPTHKAIITSSKKKVLVSGLTPGEEILILDGQIRLAVDTDSIEVYRSKYKAKFVRIRNLIDFNIDRRLASRILPKRDTGYLKDLPPSAKLVYKILEYEGALTYRELLVKSGLPPRTIRYALKKLLDKELIIRSQLDRDARRMLYMLRE